MAQANLFSTRVAPAARPLVFPAPQADGFDREAALAAIARMKRLGRVRTAAMRIHCALSAYEGALIDGLAAIGIVRREVNELHRSRDFFPRASSLLLFCSHRRIHLRAMQTTLAQIDADPPLPVPTACARLRRATDGLIEASAPRAGWRRLFARGAAKAVPHA